jgi:hypothetical protein
LPEVTLLLAILPDTLAEFKFDEKFVLGLEFLDNDDELF